MQPAGDTVSNKIMVMHYALQNITNQVFVSRYQLYLPDREQLESEFRRFMGNKKDTE